MGNIVQSFCYKVRSLLIRWFIGKGKGVADEMISCDMVSNVDVLSTRIVDGVLTNAHARGIFCHDPYGDGITELCECFEAPACLTRCGGEGHIFCFCSRRGNGLLLLREPRYSTTI